MQTAYVLFILAEDTFTAYLIFVIFIFTAYGQKIHWKPLTKFTLVGGAINYAIYILLALFSSLPQIIVYVLSSLSALSYSSVIVHKIWKLDVWRTYSLTLIAAFLQVSLSSLMASVTNIFFADFSSLHMNYYYLANVCAALAARFFLNKINFGHSVRHFLENGNHPRRTLFMAAAMELIVELIFLYQTEMPQEASLSYNAALCTLILLFVSVLLYLAYQEESSLKLQLQESMLLQQRMYLSHLEEMQKEMRAFRHDYKNTLASMYLYAKEGETEKIQEVLTKLEINFDQKIGKRISLTTQLGNIQIPEAKSLILSKLTKMEQNSIPYQLEALYPIKSIGMDIWDFNRCLGILLDNAIEAASLHQAPYVGLQLVCHDGFLTVRVTNPSDEEPDMSRIWQEGYSTKGTGRGIGLPSYIRILSQYPDTASTTSWENGTFVQECIIKSK